MLHVYIFAEITKKNDNNNYVLKNIVLVNDYVIFKLTSQYMYLYYFPVQNKKYKERLW